MEMGVDAIWHGANRLVTMVFKPIGSTNCKKRTTRPDIMD